MKTLLVGLLLCTALAAQADDGWLQLAYRKSYDLERDGHYAAALQALQSATEGTPRDYTLALRLGWLAYHSGDYPDSEHYYRSAVQAAPQAIEARLGLLLPLLAQLRWAEAEQVAYQILKDDPLNYYATLRLCVALRAQGKLDLAQRQGEKLLARYPGDSAALGQLALTLRAAGDAQQAQRLEARQRLLQPQPDRDTTEMATASPSREHP